MKRKLLIRDVSLRDGQQSLFATRMTQAQIDRVLPDLQQCHFYAMEVWGGAVPDAVMRYLNENPWDRLEKIRAGVGDTVKLAALSRGRNLFGYNPYPDEIIEGFHRNAIRSGIGIMRIFDALNDVENIRPSIAFVKKHGGIADAGVCYTVDPHFSTRERMKALLLARKVHTRHFTKEYFVNKAVELQAMGAGMITIKDMAGLIPPGKTGRLFKLLKERLDIPVNFHTHCTPGYGLASTLMAIINGADIVDTSLWYFAGGSAAPAFELIQLFCNKLHIDTGVNLEATVKVNKGLAAIRDELKEFDNYPDPPRAFDITQEKLHTDIDRLLDLAIGYAKADKDDELLQTCQQLESYFGFPPPDEKIKQAEIPGGMYSNMLAQLRQLKLEKLLPRAMELIPQVRMACGCPPLVTPTSQIVGVQAVNCVIDESKNQPHYTTRSIQFVNLVKGSYGKTPLPVDPEFRFKIAGVRDESPYSPRYHRKQDNPLFPEYGDVPLAAGEKETLLLELFPSVARDFLKRKLEDRYLAEIHAIEEEKRLKLEREKAEYDSLSEEEKKERMLQGLYNFEWMSYPDYPVGLS
ncbi:MAG TPA: carboxylase [Bacteroidales bacterium]|nr:carboxylase [Bacteroidales bacterium]HSA43115.1 carboxylase [Bacteroidales bacterium]